MSDEETLMLIEQAARRWALARGVYWAGQLTPGNDDASFDRLIQELAEQGWLPESLDDWGDAPSRTLVRLARILGREIPAAFLPILTHWLGLQLLGPVSRRASSGPMRPISTSPYIDYSNTASKLIAVPAEGGWVLDGQVPWMVNAHPACRCALVANLPEGTTVLFELDCSQAGCHMGDPLKTLGLWGVPVRHLRLSSVRVQAEALVAKGPQAVTRLAAAYRTARWAVMSLSCGAIARLHEHAVTYAQARIQGGRQIVAHTPVRKLLDTTRAAVESFTHSLERFERHPEMDFASTQVRHQARLACDSAFQVFGGIGYVCPGLPERCWRDVHQSLTLCTGIVP